MVEKRLANNTQTTDITRLMERRCTLTWQASMKVKMAILAGHPLIYLTHIIRIDRQLEQRKRVAWNIDILLHRIKVEGKVFLKNIGETIPFVADKLADRNALFSESKISTSNTSQYNYLK